MPDEPDRAAALSPLILGGSLWAMRREALGRLLELARATATSPVPQAAANMASAPTDGPGVAIITLTGVLTPHGSMLSYLLGGDYNGVQGFRDQLARAVADASVSAIVLDIDTPGGSVGLVPEAAADVRAAREVKPVYAVSNTLTASGGYWIASQATELYCTPSGMVGSIGVYYIHEDYSAMNEQMGVDVTYVYAGQYKTEGNSDEPLSDAAKAAWQADADTLYGMFVDDVAAGRGATADQVRSDYGQGRTLLASDALTAGMIDGVDTIQSVIGRALADASSSTGASARRLGHVTVIPAAPHAETTPPAGEQPAAPEPGSEEPEAPAPAPAPAAGEEPEEPAEPAGADDPPAAAAIDPQVRLMRAEQFLAARSA